VVVRACGVATVAYTDGACSGNPGPGGWAWAIPGGAYASGAAAHTTNQRMEIEAALEAARAIEGPLRIVSDSTYVVNCFRDRWWEGWLARNWVNKAKKPVANRDLWEPLIDLVRTRGDITFAWVKGHSGDPMNDLVDRLAVEAAETQKGRSGDEPPTVLGPADSVRKGAKARAKVVAAADADDRVDAVPAIDGHGLVVLGHRPPELGGYDDNPVADAVRAQLRELFEAKRAMHADLAVVSGLRLGAEMLGAEAAVDAGLPLVAVLPYPDPHSVWSAAAQERFVTLTDVARDVITLQRRLPDSKQKAGAALARRDAWLARNVTEAVLVWDGEDPALGRLHRSLEDHLGDDVWVIDPGEVVARRGAGPAGR
jgi:ribonuclease HI